MAWWKTLLLFLGGCTYLLVVIPMTGELGWTRVQNVLIYSLVFCHVFGPCVFAFHLCLLIARGLVAACRFLSRCLSGPAKI